MVNTLDQLFIDRPEAWQFLQLHTQYVHLVDDIVDEKFDKERLFRVMYLSSLLYSSDYFIRNRLLLLPIEHQVLNTYADSVNWELSGDEKKVKAADIMRHCQQDMIFAVIKLEFGYDILRKWSGKLREHWLNC